MLGQTKAKDSTKLGTDFKRREVQEIDFSSSTMFGSSRGHDFFGDGSLYFLDALGVSTTVLLPIVSTQCTAS